MTDVVRAKQIADQLREAWPEKAAEIDALIADMESGRRESFAIEASVIINVDKFNGDSGALIESIESKGTL